MRVAYADPPYVGKARKHYGPGATEVNLPVLVGTLCREYPDGWALSASAPSLQRVLSLCPPDVRVMPWVKPYAVFKPGVRVAYAWEPVIVRGGRRGGPAARGLPRVLDWVSTVPTMGGAVVGQKPAPFCMWLFRVFGLRPEDELDDVFPGSGAVGWAWEGYRRQSVLALA